MSPPFTTFVDFCAITTSSTCEGKSILHPSLPTAFNETRLIKSKRDVDELLAEVDSSDLYEKILKKHHVVRTSSGVNEAKGTIISSGVTIERILCVWMFLDPLND